MTLISKIQYRNDEPGEFTQQQERTYEDTIRLIEAFPWQQQRDHFPVNPTGPSVTIEGSQNDFLKLAPYYEGKFVLYYLDDNGHLYTKSCADLHQSYAIIQSFFEGRFSTDGFKLEKYWTRGKAIHFKDQDFHYRPNETRILFTIAMVGAYCIFMLVSFIALLIFKPVKEPQGYILIPIFALAILLFWGKFFQFINNYLAARGKELILSRGNDMFYYGRAGDPRQYNKKDIVEILVYNAGGRKLEIDGFIRIEMQSNEAPFIFIPYMVLNDGELTSKLAGCPQRRMRSVLPFIPLSAATPS